MIMAMVMPMGVGLGLVVAGRHNYTTGMCFTLVQQG